MSIGKRHHFIPQFIIRRFVRPDGYLSIFDKLRPDLRLRNELPMGVFARNHLYSTRKAGQSDDRSLEGHFAELEGLAAPIVDKIIRDARGGKAPRLDAGERKLWDFFVSQQWRRVPELHEEIVPDEKFAELMAETISEFERVLRPVTQEERRWAAEALSSPDFRQNVTVRSLRASTGRVTEALESRGLTVAMPDRADKQFVLGSRPILRAGPKGENLNHPEIEAWFILAPDVAITPYGSRGDNRLLQLNTMGVRRLNLGIARQSNVVASPSTALLLSLATPR